MNHRALSFVICLVGLIVFSGGGVLAQTIPITHIDTPVKVRRPDTTEWTRLSEDAETIPAQGDISVGKDGSLEAKKTGLHLFRMNEETTVTLPDTKLADEEEVEQLTGNNDKIELMYGSMEVETLPEFEKSDGEIIIQTAHSSMSVRGTVAGVRHEEQDNSESYVDTGTVSVSQGEQSRSLKKGQFLSVARPEKQEQLGEPTEQPDYINDLWKHWDYQRRLDSLNEKISQIQSRINSLRDSDTSESGRERSIGKLETRLERLKHRREQLKKRNEGLVKQYEAFRKARREQRREFQQSRREQLEQLRKERAEAIRELRRERQKAIEERMNEREQFRQRRRRRRQ